MNRYTPSVRRAAWLLVLALPLAASADDWDARCRELVGGTGAQRRAAAAALRRAGPGAEAALEAASKSADVDLSLAARQIAAARKWDPRSRLVNLAPLLALEEGTAEGALGAVAGLAVSGSWRAGDAVSRIIASRPAEEHAALLHALTLAPQQDSGWAAEGVRRLASPDAKARSAAARLIRIHGSFPMAADVKLALAREKDRAARSELWEALIAVARGPGDLPPLPDDPEQHAAVLGMLTRGYHSPRLAGPAWEAFERRRMPTKRGDVLGDAPRFIRIIGLEAFQATADSPIGGWDLDPTTVATLCTHRNPWARATAAEERVESPASLALIGLLLDDPDPAVRGIAVERLDDRLEAWYDLPFSERIAKYRRLAAAARTALDAGLISPDEIRLATRDLVDAGRGGSALAWIATDALRLMGDDAVDALHELEADADLGTAAATARRVLELRLPRDEVEFEEGLDSRPYLRWSAAQFDHSAWRQLAASPDRVDRSFAAELLSAGWDRISLRPELVETAKCMLQDEDPDVADSARSFAASYAPELLPDEETLRDGEAWSRSRQYVLKRLRAEAGSLAPLGAGTARSIAARGDRSLMLAALRAGRFATPQDEDQILAFGEPGALPILLQRAAELEVTNWAVWSAHVAACGPKGCRMLSGFAAGGTPARRAAAISALLASSWGGDLAGPPLADLAGKTDEESRAAFLAAASSLRYHGPLPREAADAVARVVLELADMPAPPPSFFQLIANLGSEALRGASPEVLAQLQADPRIQDAALSSRAWIGPLPDLYERVFSGPAWLRAWALESSSRKPLEQLQLGLRAWLTAGNSAERFHSRSAAGVTQLFLFAAAVQDEANRDSILEMRAILKQYNWEPPQPPVAGPSWPAVEGEIPDAFLGDSMDERDTAAWDFRSEPTPSKFAGLWAAALRGATGDDFALDVLRLHLGPDALPGLAPLLRRPDPAVRSAAALAMARAAGPARDFARAAIRAALPLETGSSQRVTMLAALARLGDEGAMEELRGEARGDDPDLRVSIAEALTAVPTRDSVLFLASLADDTDAVVRETAMSGISQMVARTDTAVDPPFGHAAAWKAFLEANPGVRIDEPANARRVIYDSYEW